MIDRDLIRECVDLEPMGLGLEFMGDDGQWIVGRDLADCLSDSTLEQLRYAPSFRIVVYAQLVERSFNPQTASPEQPLLVGSEAKTPELP
jgi:hypothetical protein